MLTLFQADAVMPAAIETKTPSIPKKQHGKKNICPAVGVNLAVALCTDSASRFSHFYWSVPAVTPFINVLYVAIIIMWVKRSLEAFLFCKVCRLALGPSLLANTQELCCFNLSTRCLYIDSVHLRCANPGKNGDILAKRAETACRFLFIAHFFFSNAWWVMQFSCLRDYKTCMIGTRHAHQDTYQLVV